MAIQAVSGSEGLDCRAALAMTVWRGQITKFGSPVRTWARCKHRHCEEHRDVAIHAVSGSEGLDCHAALAMTSLAGVSRTNKNCPHPDITPSSPVFLQERIVRPGLGMLSSDEDL